MKRYIFTIIILISPHLIAKNQIIRTNSITIHNTPSWLKRVRVDKVRDRIQSKLEWTIRRVNVYWYDNQHSFEKVHSLGSGPSAVTIKNKASQTIHIGPDINDKNFDEIFSHELVHVIFFQKYYGSIPRWLEEGFANHLSRRKKVNYHWLSRQPLPKDVREMTHPYQKTPVSAKVHYMSSQALVEMLDKKCDLENLIRLSVQRKMKDYIKTYCEIKDINHAFKLWIKENIKKSPQ